MPQPAWSSKRDRQYEHIKDSLLDRGANEDKAEEIAARTVNKERARAGEAREASRTSVDDFVMAVKVSRYLTHIKRLADPAEPVERFLDRARGLGAKLGPALIQLPPHFRCDLGRLATTLEQFPADVRVAVEFRHPSWFTEDVRR